MVAVSSGCVIVPAADNTLSADQIDYSILQWSCGGFSGASATHVQDCRIADLTVSAAGLSYTWQAGGCELLGASSLTDAVCLACLFCQSDDGSWRGGKFDWISTSRTTRDFKNLDGYKGWTRDLFNTAKGYAFVIVSADGSRRSNVIYTYNKNIEQ